MPVIKAGQERGDDLRLVDRWTEDNYTLSLYTDDDPTCETFQLWEEREGKPHHDVTGDIDAYARRIKALAELKG